MSVNPDDMNMASDVATEFVDLEHQVIKQNIDLSANTSLELLPNEAGSNFDPGERQLDREEIAQLVVYRRYATVYYNGPFNDTGSDAGITSVDASVGINGDLFRPVTTNTEITPGVFSVDEGGEIGLLDQYEVIAGAGASFSGGKAATTPMAKEYVIDYYDYPTGGPIVDSFDDITCGFAANNTDETFDSRIELRYDFWWDVAEQGRTTNPFGRPSTR